MTKNAYPLTQIQTEADYRAALRLVAPYFENEPEIDSEAGKYFEAMVALIEAYEAKHYPIDPPDHVSPQVCRHFWNRKYSDLLTGRGDT